MKTSSAKNKGRNLQKWIRDCLISELGLGENDVFSRSMGASGTDVFFSVVGEKIFPYAIEAKNQERVNVWDSYEQAKSNSKNRLEPILFIKRNRTNPLVVIDALHFIRLFKND